MIVGAESIGTQALRPSSGSDTAGGGVPLLSVSTGTGEETSAATSLPSHGSWRKYVSLVALVVQWTALLLVMRYSHDKQHQEKGPRFLVSSLVVSAELLKTAACILLVLAEQRFSVRSLRRVFQKEIVGKPLETAKMAIPAAIYALQNNLIFTAMSNLDPPTFQVTTQLKIVTTALFSVTMLGKRLKFHQWLSLLMLTTGVVLVQWPAEPVAATGYRKQNTPLPPDNSRFVGLAAVLTATAISGFAGVYLEKLLKKTTGLAVRNIQLGLFSVVFCSVGMMVLDGRRVMESGMFQAYNGVTCTIVVMQALGGLLVSAVMKYADNLLKVFASSLSIIATMLISYFCLDFHPTGSFVSGAMLVIAATFLYSCECGPAANRHDNTPKTTPPRVGIMNCVLRAPPKYH